MGVSDRHWHVIRQKIIPHQGTLQEAGIFEKAHGFNTPVLATTFTNELNVDNNDDSSKARIDVFRFPETSSLIEISENLEILALKPREPLVSEDQSGFIIRLVNNSPVPAFGEIHFARILKINSVKEVNFLELEDEAILEEPSEYNTNSGILTAKFKPHEIRTFLLL